MILKNRELDGITQELIDSNEHKGKGENHGSTIKSLRSKEGSKRKDYS